MIRIREIPLIPFLSPTTIPTLLFISFTLFCSNIEASVVQSNPFWMPLEFDIGTGYFKANVFIAGLAEDAGLIKICVNSQTTNHTLCHYMNAVEEEGQIVAPTVSIHAGIFVFPSSYVPVDSDVNVCVTVLTDEKTQCKTMRNTSEAVEEMVDIYLNRQANFTKP